MSSNDQSRSSEPGSNEDEGNFLTLSGAVRIGTALSYLSLAEQSLPFVHRSTTDNSIYLLGALEELEDILGAANVESAIVADVTRRRRNLQSEYLPDEDK